MKFAEIPQLHLVDKVHLHNMLTWQNALRLTTYTQPGTLMALGGAEEITQVNEENTDNVFGVISSRAAYLMNVRAGDNDTQSVIAIPGRVPVRVIGEVRKGDRLVSAGNGLARVPERGRN